MVAGGRRRCRAASRRRAASGPNPRTSRGQSPPILSPAMRPCPSPRHGCAASFSHLLRRGSASPTHHARFGPDGSTPPWRVRLRPSGSPPPRTWSPQSLTASLREGDEMRPQVGPRARRARATRAPSPWSG